jgi:hypothetical protein
VLDNLDEDFEPIETGVSTNRTTDVVVTPEKPKWILKRLTTKHRRIIELKVAGLCREDVGKTAGCTKEYVSMLLAQPLVIDYLRTMYDRLDEDLKHLVSPAIDTMRDMMNSPDDKVALTAATTVLRANGKLQLADEGEGLTAEDVVAKIFAISNSNVQVNILAKD